MAIKELNEEIFEALCNPKQFAKAVDTINDFTRVKLREDGFFRKVMQPLHFSNDELDRQIPYFDNEDDYAMWAMSQIGE